MEQIKIKYHTDIERLEKIEQGDWIDLRCAKDITMWEGEFVMIPLGVSMKLPDGYEAHVLPRSSTFKKYGIIMTNGMGIIDNSYCGDDDEWKFPAFCVYGKEYGQFYTRIKKGDRIAQFRIVKKQPEIEFVEVEHLDGKNRGGFGSTGV